MRTLIPVSALLVVAAGSFVLLASACETETPTTAVVDNAYPTIPDGGDTSKEVTVFKVWYTTTLFSDPVAPGAESPEQRTIPTRDTVYAILAVGWDPSSTTPPTTLLPTQSASAIAVKRGDKASISVSDATFVGNCAAGRPLTQDQADFITQRIFPGDFAGVTFDARTCASTPIPADGGSDAGQDGPSSAKDASPDAPGG